MIYPVYVYGSPVLRKVAQKIDSSYPGLMKLIDDMFETMHQSDGIGLAAPQIGNSIRLIVIDASAIVEENPEMKGFKKILINPQIVERFDEKTLYQEGCLSIPGLREEVERESKIRIQYVDENFNPFDEVYSGLAARIIQHEYDHLEGILFTDRVSAIRRQLLRGKLNAIAKGKFEADYRVRVAK